MKRGSENAQNSKDFALKTKHGRTLEDITFALCAAYQQIRQLFEKVELRAPSTQPRGVNLKKRWLRSKKGRTELDVLTQRYGVDCVQLALVVLSAQAAESEILWEPHPTRDTALWLICRSNISSTGTNRLLIEPWARRTILEAIENGDLKFFNGLSHQLRVWKKRAGHATSFAQVKSLFPRWHALIAEYWAPRPAIIRTFTGSTSKPFAGLAYFSREARLAWLNKALDAKKAKSQLSIEVLRNHIRTVQLYLPKPLIYI